MSSFFPSFINCLLSRIYFCDDHLTSYLSLSACFTEWLSFSCRAVSFSYSRYGYERTSPCRIAPLAALDIYKDRFWPCLKLSYLVHRGMNIGSNLLIWLCGLAAWLDYFDFDLVINLFHFPSIDVELKEHSTEIILVGSTCWIRCSCSSWISFIRDPIFRKRKA